MLEKQRIYRLHAELCQTLANEKRLEILSVLSEGEKTVKELTEFLGLRQANLSQHLAILRQKGVVRTRKEGVSICYRVANPKMIEACNLIREVLFEQLKETEELAKLAGPIVRRKEGERKHGIRG